MRSRRRRRNWHFSVYRCNLEEFIRRQRQVADVWARIISERIVSLTNIGYELFNGPRGDRTRKLIENLLRIAIFPLARGEKRGWCLLFMIEREGSDRTPWLQDT